MIIVNSRLLHQLHSLSVAPTFYDIRVFSLYLHAFGDFMWQRIASG